MQNQKPLQPSDKFLKKQMSFNMGLVFKRHFKHKLSPKELKQKLSTFNLKTIRTIFLKTIEVSHYPACELAEDRLNQHIKYYLSQNQY